MSGGAIFMTVVLIVTVGVTAYLIGTLLRSIQNEKRARMRLWKNFGLSLGFCVLFLLTWAAHGVAQWQQYTDEQREHNQPTEMGDFLAEFTSSTLENWQSEFLQLFSFTIMSAVLIHKGSAESKDSDDRIEAALQRIEQKLETAPTDQGVDGPLRDGDLHVLPGGFEGWSVATRSATEPEGYYDSQQEAIGAAGELASRRKVRVFIHGVDGNVRDVDDRSGDSSET